MKIYLDNCCFNRPFDDQSKIRIRLETEAKLTIQQDIKTGNFKLVWSYILDYENSRNPFKERKRHISSWKKYAAEDVQESPDLLENAVTINQKGIPKIDSLHISCAILSNCEYFLTTDDKILKKAFLIDRITINDPIGFIKENT